MSAELPLRALREDEKILLMTLLSEKENFYYIEQQIFNSSVSDLLDGGMGSIRFFGKSEKVFGGVLAEADYLDEDGVLVSITINIDTRGDLYELDF